MEDKTNYGEVIYTNSQLQQMKGYDSSSDENALNTSSMIIRVQESSFFLSFFEKKEHYLNDPFTNLNRVPEDVEFTFYDFEDKRIWRIEVPLRLIKTVKLDSSQLDMYDVELPKAYSCEIELVNSEFILVKGEYSEGSDYWFFEHSIRIKTS